MLDIYLKYRPTQRSAFAVSVAPLSAILYNLVHGNASEAESGKARALLYMCAPRSLNLIDDSCVMPAAICTCTHKCACNTVMLAEGLFRPTLLSNTKGRGGVDWRVMCTVYTQLQTQVQATCTCTVILGH